MRSAPWPRLLLPLLILALTGCPDDGLDDDTTDPYDPIDEWGTDDDSTGDDDDDDDTTEPPNPVISVDLQPTPFTIDTATSYPLTTTAVWTDGSDDRVTADAYVVADPAVVSVDAAGAVTGLAEGETTITASYGGVDSDPATVTVVAPGSLLVTVVDALLGTPLEGAELCIGDSEAPLATALTDTTGLATLAGDFSGPVSVTVKKGGYFRTSIVGATTRDLRLPVIPKSSEYTGTVEGTAVWLTDADPLEVQLGFAACSTHDNPVRFDFSSLMGADRTLSFFGAEFEMPANAVLGEVAEQFEAPAPTGPAAVFSMTGNFPIADIQAALEAAEEGGEAAALVQMLAENLGEVSYGLTPGLTVLTDETQDVGDLEPFAGMGEEVAVVVPSTPLGFSTDDTPVVFPLADLGTDGLVPIGMGAGVGGVVVHEATRTGALAGVEARYVSVVEVDGIGTGGARSAVISDAVAEGGEVLFPEFLDLTVLETPTDMDFTWSFTGDADADLHFVAIEGAAFTWHVWVGGDASSFTLDKVEPHTGLYHADWHQSAIGLRDTCFETLTQQGTPGLDEAWAHATRQSSNRLRYHVEPVE